ncbi:MAG: restriction endonuclease subunit S, partial [Giesbergeria sp.]|nr:restriction endonuclease subunit S [Giesbergeria sp.]
MTRPNLNAVAQVPSELDGAIGSSGFHVLRSRWVDPGYLFYLVQTERFIDAMCKVVQGALYPAVRPKDISAFKFLLPPAAEQTRIVAKLEELLSDLDAGVAELKAAQKKLAQYRQSLLKAAVEGALTADWRTRHTPTESGAQLLERILTERRARWQARQLAKFAAQGKTPPKDWQAKYP